MKLVNYRYKKHSTLHLGVISKDENHVISISSILGEQYAKYTMIELIKTDLPVTMTAIYQGVQADTFPKIPLEKVDLMAPIQRGIHDIICVGENYLSHQQETMDKFVTDEFLKTRKTIYFSKRASYILGDQEVIKSRLDLDEALDYEVELGVIIGDYGYKVSAENAKDIIFGFTILNDLSSRNLQLDHHQWYRGKSLDGLTAMGPWIVTRDDLSFPLEVDLKSYVNDQLRQDSNTKHLMTTVEQIIAEISDGITLEPGDIIATGTPAGVGAGFNPPRYLKKGDTIRCEIQNIGSLTNIVE